MKISTIKRLLFLALYSSFPLAALAQSTRISGTVNAIDGPVMMCNVTERDVNGRIVSAAQTDINGNFSMEIKSTKNRL